MEELSRLIVNDEVPKVLCDKKIISLDMATMVAGTKYRGEFEERNEKRLLKRLKIMMILFYLLMRFILW